MNIRFKWLLAVLATMIIVSLIICISIFMLPKFCGEFSISDKQDAINIAYKSGDNVGEVANYFDAYIKGTKKIQEAFPESTDRTKFISINTIREVYYDASADAWCVYLYPSSVLLQGSSYGIIFESDGDVITCWGEK